METSGLSALRVQAVVVWRYVLMNSGQLCAIKDGLQLMPMWLADNLAFHDMVKALLATTHLVTASI